MAPGMAPMAYAVDEDAVTQIAQSIQDGEVGVGGSHHHHHSHNSTEDANHDSFQGSGNSTHFSGSSSGGKSFMVTQFLSATSQQSRTGIIVTTSFGIAAAMIIIYSIMCDAYRVKPGDLYSRAQKRSGILKILHTAEVFPFIVAAAIIIQGFIFIGVQVGSLSSFEVSGCRLTSQLIWPAVWIVPLVVLTFSLETTFRALRPEHFRPKGRWATPICLAVVVLLDLGLWLSAFLMPSLDVCPGSLSWWTLHYSKIAVVLASGIIFTHIISGTIITLQLVKTVSVDADERIAASRIVYTLIVDTIILALAIPFWIQIVQGQLALESSQVADIGITLSGMLFGALHLLMRTNAEKLAIRPMSTPWARNKRMKLFGPSELHNRTYISQPLLDTRPNVRDHWLSEKLDEAMRSPDSASSATWTDPTPLTATMSASSMHFPPYSSTLPPNVPDTVDERPLPPEPVQVAATMRPRYSVFPSQRESNQPIDSVLSSSPPRPPPKDSWISVAGSDTSSRYIELPDPLFAQRHERKDSTMTSATVEIGIRLSSALPDMEEPRESNTQVRSVEDLTNTSSYYAPAESSSTPAYSIPQIKEPEVHSPPPRSSSRIPPPLGINIGIGALGFGPKAGLRPQLNQPTRSSPLANMSTTPATPQTSDSANEKSLGSLSPDHSSPQNLSPRRSPSTAVIGLPTSPKPVHRSPSSPHPRIKSPLAESTISSNTSPTTTSPDVLSPKDWPKWPMSRE